jgi:hypothetical protein
MKKQLALALAAAFTLSVTGTVLAAPANPFVDVPAKHWSYDAVTKLSQAGIIDGYGDGTFRGDKTISRYEMAMIVAKAMVNSDKTNAEQKAMLDKLSNEFGPELQNLGVRVTSLEKKSDRVKFNGEFRILGAGYHNTDDKDGTTKESDANTRLRLWLTGGEPTDQWQVKVRFQQVNNLKTSGARGTSVLSSGGYDNEKGQAGYSLVDSEENVKINRAYLHGNLDWGTVEAGRVGLYTGKGFQYSAPLDGIMIGVGKELKVTGYFGRALNTNLLSEGTVEFNDKDKLKIKITPPVYGDNNLAGANVDYNISKKLLFNGTYMVATPSPSNSKFQKQKYFETALSYNLAPDLVLSGIYGGSDKAEDNRGYFGVINYKDFDVSKPGSYGMYLEYAHLEKNALMNIGLTDWDLDANQKGFYYEFNYVPVKNLRLNVNYTSWKAVKGDFGGSVKGKTIGAFATYYF